MNLQKILAYDSDKRSSLLPYKINYGRKELYSTDPWYIIRKSISI